MYIIHIVIVLIESDETAIETTRFLKNVRRVVPCNEQAFNTLPAVPLPRTKCTKRESIMAPDYERFSNISRFDVTSVFTFTFTYITRQPWRQGFHL